MQTKSIFQSKTVILNALAAVSVFVPSVSGLVAKEPELVVGALSLANFLLRMFTSKKVQFFPGE